MHCSYYLSLQKSFPTIGDGPRNIPVGIDWAKKNGLAGSFGRTVRKVFPHEDVHGLAFGPLIPSQTISAKPLFQMIVERNHCQDIVQSHGISVFATPVAVRQSISALTYLALRAGVIIDYRACRNGRQRGQSSSSTPSLVRSNDTKDQVMSHKIGGCFKILYIDRCEFSKALPNLNRWICLHLQLLT